MTVTLAEAVDPSKKLTVSYDPERAGDAPLEDHRGIPVQGFSNLRAENGTPGGNNAATGAPAITGEARVGETLEASTDDIEDTDGLTGATFAYQWLADGTDIAGATEATYTLAESDEGAAITVRVTFTDDAGNEETLTSAATEAVAPPLPPLTASFHDVPAEHDGESEFSFELRFSENFAGELSPETLRDRALKTTYASVTQVTRVVSGENQRWTITVRPAIGAETATVSLPATTDCTAARGQSVLPTDARCRTRRRRPWQRRCPTSRRRRSSTCRRSTGDRAPSSASSSGSARTSAGSCRTGYSGTRPSRPQTGR